MKKKNIGIVTLLFFLMLVSVLFHYNGVNGRVDANVKTSSHNDQHSDIPSTGSIISDTFSSEKTGNQESVDEKVEIVTETLVNHIKENEIQSPVEDNKVEIIKNGDASDTNSADQQLKDELRFGDSVYVSLMDEEKFTKYINIAKQNDAKLYGVPDTDLFAIAKNGEVILQMSTGISAAPFQYAHLIEKLFSDKYKGLKENVNFVLETGATVTVELHPNISYRVYQQDEYIIASY